MSCSNAGSSRLLSQGRAQQRASSKGLLHKAGLLGGCEPKPACGAGTCRAGQCSRHTPARICLPAEPRSAVVASNSPSLQGRRTTRAAFLLLPHALCPSPHCTKGFLLALCPALAGGGETVFVIVSRTRILLQAKPILLLQFYHLHAELSTKSLLVTGRAGNLHS